MVTTIVMCRDSWETGKRGYLSCVGKGYLPNVGWRAGRADITISFRHTERDDVQVPYVTFPWLRAEIYWFENVGIIRTHEISRSRNKISVHSETIAIYDNVGQILCWKLEPISQ